MGRGNRCGAMTMLDGLSSNKAATVGIGPAGEQLIPFASAYVSGDLYRCFGRGGAGCVMGSKKLKGLVMTGSGTVDVLNRERLRAAKQMLLNRIKTEFQGWAKSHSRYETAANLEWTNEMGIIPTRNWQTGQFEGWKGIDKSTTPIGWPEKARPCAPYCPTAGTREVIIQEGHYKGAHSDVEWETIYAFGSQCGVDKMDAVIAASQMCDEFGIDTMTAGVTIGFAMECFEKGLIGLKETDGIELRFGNDRAMLAILGKLVRGEGFGKELARGSRALSQKIAGSEGFAMQTKGLEFGGYECRGLNGQALQFAISARDGCHHAYGLPARAETLDGSRQAVEGKGVQVKNAAIGRILADSMILCTFPGPVYTREILAEAASAMSETPVTVAELTEAGERIMCQERLFNMREGLSGGRTTPCPSA